MQNSSNVCAASSETSEPARRAASAQSFLRSLIKSLRAISFRRRVCSLRVEESLALGERRSLLVVRWHDRRYLLGLTAQHFRVLDAQTSLNNDDCPASESQVERP